MRIKALIEEDFIQYKKPVMFIGVCFCDWKCCLEQNLDKSICQNSDLAKFPFLEVEVDDEILIKKYLANPITRGIVFGGLEPFKQYDELYSFISSLREKTDDEVIIYTGYNLEEIIDQVTELKDFGNIIIKFGRYIPNSQKIYDKVLGVTLASDNQYAMRLDEW